MENAGDIIKDALMEITVLGAEAPVEPSDAQSSIRYLNRMMAAFDADGIHLGYTEVSNFADFITVPAGANAGIVSQLAVMLWDQFSEGQPVPPTLLARAISGKNTMRNLVVNSIASSFPSSLPMGSGNESNDRVSRFYTAAKSSIIQTQVSNAVNTVITTKAAPVKLLGVWIVGTNSDFTGDATGKMTYTGTDNIQVSIAMSFTAEPVSGSDKTLTFYAAKNGKIITNSNSAAIITAASAKRVTLIASIPMITGDYIEPYAANESDTIDVLVSDASLQVTT